jgi:hypothetical protein
MSFKSNAVIVAILSMLVVAPGVAQQAATPPGRATISLYRVAPGKHVEFLKWLAAREAIDKEIGAPPTQMYAHIDGDAWDYVAITPQLEGAAQAELDKKQEAAAKKKGLTTGPKQGIEIRQFVSWHTDTFVAGPLTAAQMVEAVK